MFWYFLVFLYVLAMILNLWFFYMEAKIEVNNGKDVLFLDAFKVFLMCIFPIFNFFLLWLFITEFSKDAVLFKGKK